VFCDGAGSKGFNWRTSVKLREPGCVGMVAGWIVVDWLPMCDGAVEVKCEISFSVSGTGLVPGCRCGPGSLDGTMTDCVEGGG
jgi:hypothetical protein